MAPAPQELPLVRLCTSKSPRRLPPHCNVATTSALGSASRSLRLKSRGVTWLGLGLGLGLGL
eukprot:scaffold52285_cov48-Phaeocystis_antarctica.AAC.1